jgi:hypothetical protein
MVFQVSATFSEHTMNAISEKINAAFWDFAKLSTATSSCKILILHAYFGVMVFDNLSACISA